MAWNGIMRTTIDISDETLAERIANTGAKTKREAILTRAR